MSLFWHSLETGLLVLAAYLAGCVIGYAARRMLHAVQHRPVGITIDKPSSPASEVARQPVQSAVTAVTAPDHAASKAITEAEQQARPVPVPEPSPMRRPAERLAASTTDDTILPQPALAIAKPAPTSRRKLVTPDPRPKALSAPRNGAPDNLRQIKGVGPKIEALLHEMGIFHLDQIAAWSPENIEWVDARLAFKGRVTREDWVGQARTLLGLAN